MLDSRPRTKSYRWTSRAGIAALAACGVASLAQPAGAQAPRNLEFYVGYSAGGGSDTQARIVANHIGRHYPGAPNVVVRNMPGAGTITLANYLFSVAARDGGTFGIIAGGAVTAPLFKTKGAAYDPREFTWIGNVSSEVSIAAAWHTSGVKTLADAMQREVVLGTAGPGSGNHIYPLVLNAVLGTKFKLISGYPGSNEVAIAMERGEVQGTGSWNISGIMQSRPDWLKDGLLIPLVQQSLSKHPSLPDVPLVTELGKTEADRKVLQLIFAQQVISRPLLAPPQIAPERAQALRAAFDTTMKDAAFLDDAAKRRMEITDPMTADQVKTLLNELYATPSDVIERAIAAVNNGN